MKKKLPEKMKKRLIVSPKKRIREFVENFKELQGDPHYVATGIAIGVFIGVTPTIPFHMILALIFAYVFRCSGPAAVTGVWFSNPITIPFFYIGSYKVGTFLTGEKTHDLELITSLMDALENKIQFSAKSSAIINFLKLELHTFYIMILGGIVLGIPFGVAAYFITHKVVTRMRQSEDSKE